MGTSRPDTHTIVVDALTRLQHALAEGDVDGAAYCFVPDGALFGSGVTEDAHGTREIRAALQVVVDRDLRPQWDLDLAYLKLDDSEGGALWFVGVAAVTVHGPSGRSRQRRERISGTLRGSYDFYRFELFNGLSSVFGADLRLVG